MLDAAGAADVTELVQLREQAEAWLAARGVRQWLPGEVTRDDVVRQVEAGEWHVLRGTGAHLVGGLRLLWSDPAIWGHEDCFATYVHGLMVDRAHSGRGLGEAMLAWAEAQGRARGAVLFRLDCCESNGVLRAYYARQGFAEVGRRDFEGAWFSATLFEKRL